MTGRDPDGLSLQAYHDGELSWLGRWRMQRRLAREPDLRRELEGLQLLGGLLREVDAEVPTPDVWERVRMGLPAIDARRAEEVEDREAPAGGAARWVGAALAAAAAGLALMVSLNLGTPDAPGSLRWLDSRGNAVLVLQDDRDATIIWLLEPPPDELSRRTTSVFG